MMWVACSSDDTANPDAGDGSVQDVKADKKTPPDTGGDDVTQGQCQPATTIDTNQLTYTPPITPNPSACTDVQVQTLFNSCFNAQTKSSTACNAFLNAAGNATCKGCMLTNWPKDKAFGTLIAVGGVDYANTSGCVAILTNDTTSTGCAAKLQPLIECEYLACSTACPQVTDDATFAEYQKCTAAADQGVCKTYIDAECNLSDAGAVYTTCLNHQNFQDYYFAIAPVFCGAMPADAGAGDAGSDGGDAGAQDGGAADATADAPDGD